MKKISNISKFSFFIRTKSLQQFIRFGNFSNSKQVISQSSLIQVQSSIKNDHVLLSLVPPTTMDGISRTPTTVVCVIDVSGSMGSEALIKTDGDKTEAFGFSTLDLVKHSILTIIKSLTKDDKLSLVSFTNKAKVVLNLTVMDETGKDEAAEAVNELRPEATTNLWDGLFQGMEVLRKQQSNLSHKNSAILLLTDGMPNVEPPRGHIPQLEKYQRNAGGELPGTINTFGFGYSLDSKLLNDIAVLGKGTYSFIPDGTMVGTIFVNSISNLLSNMALNTEVLLNLSNVKLTNPDFLKNFHFDVSNDGLKLKIGSIQFGQNKSLVLPISFIDNNKKTLQGSLKYRSPFHDNYESQFLCQTTNENDPQAQISYFRIKIANLLLQNFALTDFQDYILKLQELIQEIENSDVKEDLYIKDLLRDLTEQATLALENRYYQKWGKHYLLSLARAHLLQQCNNFKDPGVQHFGGKIFKDNRDKLDDIFLSLAPPKPSLQRSSHFNSNTFFNSYVNSGNVMKRFYDASGVCFHGDCSVLMNDGSSKKSVKDITKGDLIYSNQGKPAKVKCVIKTIIKTKNTGLAHLEGGLKITPWHPVRVNNIFQFPCNIGLVMLVDCEEVFNFVLEDLHIMNINGYECVTLGHGFKENSVVKHEYFGTDKIIIDFQKIDGWEKGLIELKSEWISRDENSGRINSVINIK